uniref:Uncharacterized protein n=1 Tax=Oryza brachyantha TaxID=4533 RepID=J3KUZ9_ORYBR
MPNQGARKAMEGAERASYSLCSMQTQKGEICIDSGTVFCTEAARVVGGGPKRSLAGGRDRGQRHPGEAWPAADCKSFRWRA